MRTLNDETEFSTGRVLVMFSTTTCTKCKFMGVMVDKLSDKYDSVLFAKFYIDDYLDIAKKYNVVDLPTCIMFQDGVEQGRTVGVVPKAAIESVLQKGM